MYPTASLLRTDIFLYDCSAVLLCIGPASHDILILAGEPRRALRGGGDTPANKPLFIIHSLASFRYNVVQVCPKAA